MILKVLLALPTVVSKAIPTFLGLCYGSTPPLTTKIGISLPLL